MQKPQFSWTDENVAIMTKMMGKGKSSRDVALALGITRNAVIGKALRLDIPRNRNKGSKQPAPKVAVATPSQAKAEQPKYLDRVGIQKARRERDAAGIAPTAQPYEPATDVPERPNMAQLSLVDLTEKTCKWPVGDPLAEDFYFCGAKRTRGPYCGHHAAIARGKGTESERKAVSVGRLVR